MPTIRSLRAIACAGLLAALCVPGAAHAADAPTIDVALDAARVLVKERRWQDGADAVRALLDARNDDPDMLPRIGEAEDLLRRCLFGLSGWTLDPVAALGRGAVKFVPSTRAAEFEIDPGAAVWTRRADFSRTLDVPFDGDVTVEMPWADAANWAVLLAYDPVVRTGLRFEVRPPDHSGGAGRIVRMDDDGASKDLSDVTAPKAAAAPKVARVKRAGSMVVVYADRTQIAQAVFVGERRGLVGLRPAADVADGDGVPRVHITGKLDERFAKKVLAGAEAEAFRTWSAKRYRREGALPRWVLDAERSAGAWAAPAPRGSDAERPNDVPESARVALQDAVRAFFERDPVALAARDDELGPVVLPENDRVLLEAFVWGARASHGTAETKLREVLAADPKSVLATAALAVCALRRGAESEALDLARSARALDAAYAPAHDVAAEVAFRAGDLSAMKDALDDAARHRTASRRTVELRSALDRIRRGPAWAKRIDVTAGRVDAAADGDRAGCAALARIVDDAVAEYHATFRQLPRATRIRVVCFADDGQWLAWGQERGLDVDGAAAAYDSALREIGLRSGDDAANRFGPGGAACGDLRAAVFRACLHREIEETPAWLDVGGARWFAEGGAVEPTPKNEAGQGASALGRARESTLLARYSRRFLPLADLFAADRAAFEDSGDVLGVESWAVVRALRDDSDASLRGRLAAYVGALASGARREVAGGDTLQPVLLKIQAALARRGGAPR